MNPFSFETNGEIIYIAPNSTHTLAIKTKGQRVKELKFEVLNGIGRAPI